MKKLVFAITSLHPGGAERVLIDIVNKLQENYQITIVTLYGNGEFTNQVESGVKVVSIYDKKQEDYTRLGRLKISLSLLLGFFRKKIYKKYFMNKYDVEIAFLEGPVTWLLSVYNTKARKIAWIHNDISKVFGDGIKAKLKEKINNKIYNNYDNLVFVSRDNLDNFKNTYPENKIDKRVIYNYINKDVVIKKAQAKKISEIKKDLPSFVQVSRLTEQKAISRLIDVHKKLINNKVMHRIYVVGDGPLKKNLQDKIDELKLNDTFILLGQRENPYPYIKNADNFLLVSYYEGYPMVLLEAKVLGKRILITDTAAREVLLDYSNSKIVANSEEGIYKGIKEMINTSDKDYKKDEFTNEFILDKIKELLGE